MFAGKYHPYPAYVVNMQGKIYLEWHQRTVGNHLWLMRKKPTLQWTKSSSSQIHMPLELQHKLSQYTINSSTHETTYDCVMQEKGHQYRGCYIVW